MSLGLTAGEMRTFVAMAPDEQRALLAELSPADLLAFDADFETWAHDGQRPPPSEGWRVWLMMAGRGYGKTRAGAEWIHRLAMGGGKRIALVGASIDEARAVMIEGTSGVISVARSRRVKLRWEPSLKQIRWPRGSIATLFSGDHADGLRGPEHDFAWSLQRIDFLLCPVVEEPPRQAPPVSPVIGQAFIVAGGATGAWAGHDGDIAGFGEGGWRFITALDGSAVLERVSGQMLLRRAGSWETGIVRGQEFRVGGLPVVRARQPAIAAAAGGAVVDTEGRATVSGILAALRTHGLIAP